MANYLQTFRLRVAEAKDADTVLSILKSHPTYMSVSSEVWTTLIVMAASLTRHVNVSLLRYFADNALRYHDDETVRCLLANRYIPDEEWELALASFLGLNPEGGDEYYEFLSRLISSLAKVGRLRSDGPVAAALRAGVDTSHSILQKNECAKLLLHFPDVDPPPTCDLSAYFNARFMLHPRAGVEHWGQMLAFADRFECPELVKYIMATPDALASQEVRARIRQLPRALAPYLTVEQAIAIIEEYPDLAAWITAVVINRALRNQMPIPPTFAEFITQKLAPEDWTALLASSRFEVRLAVQQLLGRSSEHPKRKGKR